MLRRKSCVVVLYFTGWEEISTKYDGNKFVIEFKFTRVKIYSIKHN